MDNVNRVLLDRIQRSFPLHPKPYEVLAEGLGLDGSAVRERIADLKSHRLVRQISGIFNTGALGYKSSLVAMAVPDERMEETAEIVNRYPGVSHNYLREGRYNMWYTIAVPPGKRLDEVVHELAHGSGGWPTLILPALRKYKLAVVLDVLEEGDLDTTEERLDMPLTEAGLPFRPSPQNIRIVRCIQEDLPLVDRPFKAWAESLGMAETELLGLISEWITLGYMRRFAAVLNHRQVGFSANGMVVWYCPEEGIDEKGNILASSPEVSHCYHRPACSVWPFNLYAMVHARTIEDCRRTADKLSESIHLPGHQILFSSREFKKKRLKLFWD